jgi:hypothetical protein
MIHFLCKTTETVRTSGAVCDRADSCYIDCSEWSVCLEHVELLEERAFLAASCRSIHTKQVQYESLGSHRASRTSSAIAKGAKLNRLQHSCTKQKFKAHILLRRIGKCLHLDTHTA